MNKYKYLIKNVGLFTLSSFATKILTFLILPLYTYYLTTSEYATIDLINLTISLLIPIFTFCLNDAIVRFVIGNKEKKDSYFINALFVVCSMFVLLLILCPIFKWIPIINSFIKEFYIIYLLTSLNYLYSDFARSRDKINVVIFNSIIQTLLLLSLNVIFIAKFSLGINGYLYSTILSLFVSDFILIVITKVNYSIKEIKKEYIVEMMKYSLPLVPNSIFWWINSSMDRYSLSILTSLSTVGLYSVANKIPTILNVMITIFQQAWNLSAFQEFDKKDSKFFQNIFLLLTYISVFGGSLLIVLNKLLAIILFQKEFYDAWKFVPFLVLAFVFSAYNSYFGSFYTASKKTKGLFTTTLYGALLNLILNFSLVPIIGGNGAALATCLSNFIVFVLRLRNSKKIMDINYDLKLQILLIMLLFIQAFVSILNYQLINFAIFLIIDLIIFFSLKSQRKIKR